MRLGIVGSFTGSHIGASFARAAQKQGWAVTRFESANAYSANRVAQGLAWRLASRRPLRLNRFSDTVFDACRDDQVAALLTTGLAPLNAETIHRLRANGATTINFLTDDPWNKAQGAARQLSALRAHDLVFTPRHANLEDLQRAGCERVAYLPFAYDEDLIVASEDWTGPALDVLFVGGADRDRRAFVNGYRAAAGPSLTLIGQYWSGPQWLGSLSPAGVNAATRAAKVNLCLVRKANRDDHVMRSFELASLGACVLAEDTPAHRELFGEGALYFQTPMQAAAKSQTLLGDPQRRKRMGELVRARVLSAPNTYRDRLNSMIEAASRINAGTPSLGASNAKAKAG